MSSHVGSHLGSAAALQGSQSTVFAFDQDSAIVYAVVALDTD